MTTTTKTNFTRLTLAATISALVLGATACGTEHEAASKPSAGRPQPLSSIDLIETAKANQSAYLEQLRAERAQQLRAEKADAARWAHGYTAPAYGDDRRGPHNQVTRRRAAQHNPGFDKALQAER